VAQGIGPEFKPQYHKKKKRKEKKKIRFKELDRGQCGHRKIDQEERVEMR
jgi:hypothetical protein